MELSDDDCAALLAGFDELDDLREAPDARRCGQFRTGWREATGQGREYTDATLKRLTWRNLGYRLGWQWGERSAAEIDEMCQRFARYFRERHPTSTTSASPGHWQADIHAWVHRHRQLPDALAEHLVTFFTHCFEHNRCPEHAWFGISTRAVSLVVGQLHLGALTRSGGSDDRGLWLLLDRPLDDIPGLDCRVVKSTRADPAPLTWGHLETLEHLPALNDHAGLWTSHGAASRRIMDFPVASARSEVFHRRHHRQRLTEFWPALDRAAAPPLPPDLSAVSRALEAGGAFDPESTEDARRRIERAIVQRQGQGRFREALLANYGGRCPITGCDLPEALEAAHIVPYNGEQTNHPANGLPLRADIHTLFDLHLLSIEPESRTVVIAPKLRESCYAGLAGKMLEGSVRGPEPDRIALVAHYQVFLKYTGQ